MSRKTSSMLNYANSIMNIVAKERISNKYVHTIRIEKLQPFTVSKLNYAEKVNGNSSIIVNRSPSAFKVEIGVAITVLVT